MGFLSGFISPGLIATAQAVAGHQEGDIQSALMKMQQDRQKKEDDLKAILQGMQVKNLGSEIFTREHPKPTYDSDRGVMVTPEGTSTPVAGIEPKQHAPIEGTPEWEAAETKKAKIHAEFAPPPAQFSFGTTVDPETGKPLVLRQNTHTGDVTPTDAVKPTAGGGGQGAQQMAAAKANFESAQKVMAEYEAKLKANPSLYGPMDATMGSAASSPTALTAQHPWDLPMSLAANEASSHLQARNPELMRYMTAKKLIAEAVLNTHKRPNQTQYEIEQELGGVGPNPTPMQIDMLAQRRQRMYHELFGGGQAPPEPSKVPSHTGASDPGGDINLGQAAPPKKKRTAAEILAAHGIK